MIDYLTRPRAYDAASLWYLITSLWTITMRLTTLFMVVTGVSLTYCCWYFNIQTDMPLTLLTVGIIFPLSFTISFEIGRRERILLDVASLKASSIALYYHSREWPPAAQAPIFSESIRQILEELLKEISLYLHHKKQNIHLIYHKFDELNHVCEEIRRSDDWIKSVVSRLYQYVRFMINDFERLRTVTDFHTPSTFRAFTFIWITCFPIIFAPYSAKLSETQGISSAIYVEMVLTMMLAGLYNASVQLEDPFDGDGPDDLNMEMIREPTFLMFERTRGDVNKMLLEEAKLQREVERELDARRAHHKHAGGEMTEPVGRKNKSATTDDVPQLKEKQTKEDKHQAMEDEKARLRDSVEEKKEADKGESKKKETKKKETEAERKERKRRERIEQAEKEGSADENH